MKSINTGKLAGRFTMIAEKPDGSRRVLAEFDNLILNQGLNQIGSGGIATYCHVGAGSTAPVVTDSGMQAFVGSAGPYAVASGYESADPWYGWARRTYRFAPGAADGNLSEVGVGWGDTGTTLFSRALILDPLGDPTTITVLPDEILDVVYELRLYPPTADQTFDVVVGGVTHAVTLRAAGLSTGSWQPSQIFDAGTIYVPGVTVYDAQTLGTKFEQPSGTQVFSQNATYISYVNNSLKRDFTLVAGLDDANVAGGIGAVAWYSNWGGSFQANFTPKIAKDNTKVLNLNLSIGWARH